ncbi:MAG: aldehyde dehydrogenase (NADP(+)) [Bacteroidota bacterium]|jgi:NADP-dependent aldehyde dehydrogenase
MTGANFIGYKRSALGSATFQTIDPVTGNNLEVSFTEATIEEVDLSIALAQSCFSVFASTTLVDRAQFLNTIADEIESLGDFLIDRYCNESGLGLQRAIAERTRTVDQLRAFAKEVVKGDWLDVSIDLVETGFSPKRIDIRRMMKGIGPVVVFGAGNFPLAYSTAGGDTASALAAGCPVIVKVHPSHAGTNELVATAIVTAARKTGMPEGVFSSINSHGFDHGQYLVQHPDVKAVGFTGSFSGGMALYKLAALREEPIPVFAEMGSLNPVIVLRDVVEFNTEKVTDLLAESVTADAGQFCTKPGLIFVEEDRKRTFEKLLGQKITAKVAKVMLSPQMCQRYESLRNDALARSGELHYASEGKGLNVGSNTLAVINADQFLANPEWNQEVFGPFSLLVHCNSSDDIQRCLDVLHGQLTCSLFSEDYDRAFYMRLVSRFEEMAGRIIWNGVPTGVAVCGAMTHGGPYPATTDPRFTAVGPESIRRFLRPVTFQNFPDELLPPALQNLNTLGIRRRINGHFTVENVSVC